jgi:chromosomal replication initiator protein
VPEARSDDLTPIWDTAREDLRASLPASTYRLWVEPLKPVALRQGTLYLSAPESIRAWVDRRYGSRLLAAARRSEPSIAGMVFVPSRADLPAAEASAGPESLPVDPAHTFDRFVIGTGNRLAHAAALAVAELPGEAYNPLFLHGPPGLGKTHLLGAVADYLRRRRPELCVHYTTAERFTNDFVGALRSSGPDRFKERYRTLDALLIDDVQVLEGKQRTEEEFVHTFNELFAAGKQIVLSSDRPPSALERLAERLRQRLEWGLCVELGAPDMRTRTALLWRLATMGPLDLGDPGVLREIATRSPGNVRRLEGAMTRVVAVASMLGEPLSRPLVKRALGHTPQEALPVAGDNTPTIRAIQDAVCAVLDVSREDLLSARRTARLVRARQLAMYLSRELTQLSLAEIAREFGRDHTTILHAVRTVAGRLEPDSDTAKLVHRVELTLGTSHGESSSRVLPIPGQSRHPQDAHQASPGSTSYE